ncbi:MAG: CPBP family intramembrane metalloprotease, partial [Candidatus Obscuribacterales bacterium]|nr:CPBP family intramembrane metalloprotease [Candidatus Obscuribacterales bacterium]
FSLVLLAGLIAVLILMNFDLDHWSSPGSEKISQSVRHASSAFVIVISLVQACLTGVLVEELFFRAFLFNCLRSKMPFFGAAFISSFLWALAHESIFGMFWYLPEGFILAYVYERSGRLLAPLFNHFFWNFSLLCINAFVLSSPKF